MPESPAGRGFHFTGLFAAVALFFLVLLFAATGCQSTPPAYQGSELTNAEPVVLREGDVVVVQFPGAPNLNAEQQIRRDGKIKLAFVDEVVAAGKTTKELEKELLRLYGDQINTKQINVTVRSSSFTVVVSGAVLHAGKITSDRPMTALQAVMEAGVDYSKANLSKVQVIRTVNDQTERIIVDLSRAMKGLVSKPFYLKQGDIIFVPERFVWF